MMEDNALVLTDHFFDECAEGQIRFVIERYDGKTVELWATRDHDSVVTGKAEPVDLAAYSDIVPDAWYGEAAFTPSGPLTRAQMCQIVYIMAGAPQPSGKAEFNDVAQDAWYAAPIA